MKKTISLILLLSFILTSCSSKTTETTEQESTAKYVKTQEIKETNFTEDLKLIGKVASSQEVVVSPLTNGNIKSINAKVGDKVSVGDVLATIDTQSNLTNISLNNAENTYNNTLIVYNSTKEYLEKNLETMKLQYENAVQSRDNVYSSTQKQLEIAQANLESIKSQKNNTSKTSDSTINVAQNSLDNAKLSLENFEKNAIEIAKSLENKKKTTIDNISVSIDNSIATFDSSITYVDTILGVTNINKQLNNDYEIYLSAKNTTYKTQAEMEFGEVYSDFTSLKSLYDNNKLSESDISNYYSKIINLNDKLISLLDKMVSVLDNSIPAANFSDSTILTYKNNIKSYQSQVISLKSSLVSLNNLLTDVENTIVSTNISNETQRASLDQAVKIAESNFENTKSSTQSSDDNLTSSEKATQLQLESTIESIKSSCDNADNAVAVAKSQYDGAVANYNSSLASNKSQLDNAAGNKNTYEQQLSNAQIKAPISGIITDKKIDIGTLVSSATQAFSISNSSKKIIKLDVTSENIKFFEIGQEVKLGKDSETATGTINVVGTNTDELSGMYKVEVTFNDKNFNEYLSLGNYIDVYVTKTATDEKYLMIPFSSLIVGSNETYSVYIVGDDNKALEKEVTIGDSNSTQVVIISGLKDGDKVVIEGALSIGSGDEVKEMQ